MIPEVAHIYGLFDPRIPDVIWYVGKTNNFYSRLHFHKKKAKKFKKPTPVMQWIRRLWEEGSEPQLRVLETCPFSEWKERERAAIALYRKKNLLLLNVHDGGEGTAVRDAKQCCECGEKRVRLYPSDGSLRCPICRKLQRKAYEAKWAASNQEHLRKYKSDWYLRNKERILADRKQKYWQLEKAT